MAPPGASRSQEPPEGRSTRLSLSSAKKQTRVKSACHQRMSSTQSLRCLEVLAINACHQRSRPGVAPLNLFTKHLWGGHCV